MSDEKLIDKFLRDKFHITVEDCDRLLITFSFELHKSGGSHRVYHKKAENPIIVVTPKTSRYVKPAYINSINKRLNLEEEEHGE